MDCFGRVVPSNACGLHIYLRKEVQSDVVNQSTLHLPIAAGNQYKDGSANILKVIACWRMGNSK